jgi:two-component system chemotaxis response regulator CheB
MLSTLTTAGAPATIRALELGAVDFLQKPAPPAAGVSTLEALLAQTVRAAANATVRRPSALALAAALGTVPAGLRRAKPAPNPGSGTRPERLLAIGCSTGGPRALMEVVPHLPGNLPAAVVIVQHMPAGFTRSLAERLDSASALHVKEAEDGDQAAPGLALLAPGGRHMTLHPDGRVLLTDAAPVHGVRPSVDVLFRTLPAVAGGRCVGVILTGMGSDGADGAAAIRESGGRIVAEDASTTVVYGMPRAVAERGLAHALAPLPKIAGIVTDMVLNDRTAARVA